MEHLVYTVYVALHNTVVCAVALHTFITENVVTNRIEILDFIYIAKRTN
jgi:hypothetical protein